MAAANSPVSEEDVVREKVGVDRRRPAGPVGQARRSGAQIARRWSPPAPASAPRPRRRRPANSGAQAAWPRSLARGLRKPRAGQVQPGQALARPRGSGRRSAGAPTGPTGSETMAAGLPRTALQQRARRGRRSARRRESRARASQRHQPQEERQVLRLHPPLIDGQDDSGPRSVSSRKLEFSTPSAMPLNASGRAEVEVGQEGLELLVGDVGIDGHARASGRRAPRSRACAASPCRRRHSRGVGLAVGTARAKGEQSSCPSRSSPS